MAINPDSILNDISFQKAVAKQMAKMRATGSWKAGALDGIFATMAEGKEKQRLQDLRYLAQKEQAQFELGRQKNQFDQRYSLARDEADFRKKDTMMGDLISAGGVVASGVNAYDQYKDDKQRANEMRLLRERLYPTRIADTYGGANIY